MKVFALLLASSLALAARAADALLPCDGILGQVYTNTLLVAPGGWLSLYVDFVLPEWPTACDDGDSDAIDNRRHHRRLDGAPAPAPLTELEVTVTTVIDDNDRGFTSLGKYNHTSPSSSPKQKQFGGAGKYDQDEVTLKFSKLTPQAWKPKLTYDLVNDGNTVVWTLPKNGIAFNKQYKMTSKLYVGKNLRSGDEIIFTVDISDIFTEEVVVTVK
jgi:hypothetical protein